VRSQIRKVHRTKGKGFYPSQVLNGHLLELLAQSVDPENNRCSLCSNSTPLANLLKPKDPLHPLVLEQTHRCRPRNVHWLPRHLLHGIQNVQLHRLHKFKKILNQPQILNQDRLRCLLTEQQPVYQTNPLYRILRTTQWPNSLMLLRSGFPTHGKRMHPALMGGMLPL